MNELQAEKKAIHSALASIRASDNASGTANSVRSRPSFPDRPLDQAYSACPEFVPPIKPINLQSETKPVEQSTIQTARQSSFPDQTSNSLRSPRRIPAAVQTARPSSILSHQPQTQVNPTDPPLQDAALRRLRSIVAQIDQERRETEPSLAEKLAVKPYPKLYPKSCPERDDRPAQQRNAQRQADQSHCNIEGDRAAVKPALPLAQSVSLPPIQAATPTVTVRLQASDQASAAQEVAQLLRQLQQRPPAENTYPDPLHQAFVPSRARKRSSLLRRLRRTLLGKANRPASRRAASAPLPFTLRETLTLLLGAALSRLLLNLLLQIVPVLAIPLMLLLIVPAAIAVRQITVRPEAGIVWGYRLCIILLGLLLGGRI